MAYRNNLEDYMKVALKQTSVSLFYTIKLKFAGRL